MAWRITRQAIFCICIEIVTIQRKMRIFFVVSKIIHIFAKAIVINQWRYDWNNKYNRYVYAYIVIAE